MFNDPLYSALSDVAEMKRRALPIELSLAIFAGGAAGLVMTSVAPLFWSLAAIAILTADTVVHRRVADADSVWPKRYEAMWRFALSSVFCALPVMLWLDGRAATAFAAIALLAASAIRNLSDTSDSREIILAGAAPALLAMCLAPLCSALLSSEADLAMNMLGALCGSALSASLITSADRDVIIALLAHLAAHAAGQIKRARGRLNHALLQVFTSNQLTPN